MGSYSSHLDWHFRARRRERDNARKAQSRLESEKEISIPICNFFLETKEKSCRYTKILFSIYVVMEKNAIVFFFASFSVTNWLLLY